jgi:hypothetical protein
MLEKMVYTENKDEVHVDEFVTGPVVTYLSA